MKTPTPFPLFFLFFILSSTSFSQGLLTKSDLRSSVRTLRAYSIYDAVNRPLDEEDPVVGTPYYDEKYLKGSLYTRIGTFTDVDIRYNVYDDKIEFKEKDSVLSIGADSVIHKVCFGKHTLVIDKFPFKGKVYHSYYLRLDSGQISLMARPSITYKDRVEPKAIQTEGSPPAFVRGPDSYYVKVGKAWPTKISGMKSLIDTLPHSKKEMEEFAKREKISPKDAQDLTTFFRHYNSLSPN